MIRIILPAAASVAAIALWLSSGLIVAGWLAARLDPGLAYLRLFG